MSGGASLFERIAQLADGFSGQLAVCAVDLTSGERIEYQAGLPLPIASVIKTPILISLLQRWRSGSVDLDRRIDLSDASLIGGSGVLSLFGPGIRPTVRDLATLMIAVSDNTATNIVLDLVGGHEAVTQDMAQLGLSSIRMFQPIDLARSGRDAATLALANMQDLCALFEKIWSGQGLSPKVAALALSIHKQQRYVDQVARYSGIDPWGASIGEESPISIASKTGVWYGTWADSGVLTFAGGGGFVYACANQGGDDGTHPETEGAVLNGLVGRLLIEHWWPSDRIADLPIIQTPNVTDWPRGR